MIAEVTDSVVNVSAVRFSPIHEITISGVVSP